MAGRGNLKAARKTAGLTQQQMADKLYNGSFEIWDALEDMLGIHQRKLREIIDIRPGPVENQ